MIQSQTQWSCAQPCDQSVLERALRSNRTLQPELLLETTRALCRQKNNDGSYYAEKLNQVERTVCSITECKYKTPKIGPSAVGLFVTGSWDLTAGKFFMKNTIKI